MQRSEYKDVITARVRQYGKGKKKYTYKKNDPQMRSILLSDCSCDEKESIKRAEKQAESFDNESFHTHNPCTMVYKPVKQLRGEDKEFVKRIKDELEEK